MYGWTIITAATARTISAVNSALGLKHHDGEQDDHERRPEQDHQEAGHDPADQHVDAEPREQQAHGERDTGRGEDAGNVGPPRKPLLNATASRSSLARAISSSWGEP